jgi:hypothetical protein
MASPKGRRRRRAKRREAAEAAAAAVVEPVVVKEVVSEAPATVSETKKVSVTQVVVSKAKKFKSKLTTRTES